jgi:inner membrane transporter RhtA
MPPPPAQHRPRALPTVPAGLLVIIAAMSVQVGAAVATGLFEAYGPITIVGLRLVFGAALVVAVRPPRLHSARGSAWRSALALGVILAVMNTSFYLAISRIPLGVAVTIEFLGPLAAAVLGSRRWSDLAWVALAATGIWLLVGGGFEADDLVGVAAAACAGACWFAFILVGGRVARDWPDGRGAGAAMAVSALLIIPVVAVLGDPGAIVASPGVLVAGLVIGLFSSAVPYTFEVAALGRMRPATYGILVSLEPAFAAIAGFLLLAQPLTMDELVAIGLVSAASIGASLTARSIPEPPGELGA